MIQSLARDSSADIEIFVVPVLQDNNSYLVHRRNSLDTIAIDPSEPVALQSALEAKGLQLKAILNTHHHHDHVGGNQVLAERWGAEVFCSKYDLARIPMARHGLADSGLIEIAGLEFTILEIPGHTQGQIAFWLKEADAVFVGDTLFAMGCGRLLEGTPRQMTQSLTRLCGLPSQTRLYFGHEYTAKNASFTLLFESENPLIEKRRLEALEALQNKRRPEPATLAEELQVNPFLRLSNPSIRRQLHLEAASDLDVFTELRSRRDRF